MEQKPSLVLKHAPNDHYLSDSDHYEYLVTDVAAYVVVLLICWYQMNIQVLKLQK